jgi:transketolase
VTIQTETVQAADLDRLAVDTVRTLAMDAIQKAGSGHPGTAMALAPAAYVLWTQFLKFDPADPDWPDRDRFVLSNGHASVLQYAVLHLTGYPLGIRDLRDLKQQRQWGSLTPGHPEYRHTPGVEVTTGPLGQGVGNGVGFAIAERLLAASHNRPGREVMDHRTWVFCGGGGVGGGVVAGRAPAARQADAAVRRQPHHHRRAHRDHLHRGRGQAVRGLRLARAARRGRQRPGGDRRRVPGGRGRAGAAELHPPAHPHRLGGAQRGGHLQGAWGGPGRGRGQGTKEVYGWNPDKHFKVPDGVPVRWQVRVPTNRKARAAWQRRMRAYAEAEPALAAELDTALAGELPAGWDADLDKLFAEPTKQATRKASQQAINAIAPNLPNLVGGSASRAAGVVEVPSRGRLRRRTGTRSPSSRHSRWIALRFAVQPCSRSWTHARR